MIESTTEKLQKVLARHGFGSRRELEAWITDGRVSVNGKRATLGDRVGPDDLIRVDGRRLARSSSPRAPRVIRYHKPIGEVYVFDGTNMWEGPVDEHYRPHGYGKYRIGALRNEDDNARPACRSR